MGQMHGLNHDPATNGCAGPGSLLSFLSLGVLCGRGWEGVSIKEIA